MKRFFQKLPACCSIRNYASKAFVILSAAKDLAAAGLAAVMDFRKQLGPNHAAKKCRARSFAAQTPLKMTGISANLFIGHSTKYIFPRVTAIFSRVALRRRFIRRGSFPRGCDESACPQRVPRTARDQVAARPGAGHPRGHRRYCWYWLRVGCLLRCLGFSAGVDGRGRASSVRSVKSLDGLQTVMLPRRDNRRATLLGEPLVSPGDHL